MIARTFLGGWRHDASQGRRGDQRGPLRHQACHRLAPRSDTPGKTFDDRPTISSEPHICMRQEGDTGLDSPLLGSG
jgi:hypothetical protein